MADESSTFTAQSVLIPRRHGFGGFIHELRRWPVLPLFILVLLAVSAIFAEQLTAYHPERADLRDRNAPPMWQEGGSSKHVLGADPLGRDILARVIYGSRISMIIASIVLSIGTIAGLTVGLAAGYLGGDVDEILMRFVDFTLAVPFILMALVAVIVFGQSFTLIIILLTVFSWNSTARQVRAETLSLKTRDYVAFARVAGASTLFPAQLAPVGGSQLVIVKIIPVGGFHEV